MKSRRRALTILLLLLLSAFFSFLALGIKTGTPVYPQELDTPGVPLNVSGFYRDGWIADGAQIQVEGIFPAGNRLELRLNNWRPPGLKPALIRVDLCGERVGEFEVSGDRSEYSLPLSGLCWPKTLTFDVLNPFQPSENDSRALGAQFYSMRLSSLAGVPIVSLRTVVPLWVLLAILSAVVYFGISRFKYPLTFFSLVLPTLVISISAIQDLNNLLYLLAAFTALIAGWQYAGNSHSVHRAMQATSRSGTADYFLLLGLVLLLAAGLRFYGLDFGLPHNHHPDEIPKVNAVMRMWAQSDLNPGYFLHPSLLLYSTYAMNLLFHSFGVQGSFAETAFLAGRTVSAIAGILSVILVAETGRLTISRRAGLVSGLLLAIVPIHVTCSRYLKEDALLVFFTLLTLYFVILAVERNRLFFLCLSGIAAGLSASTKYSGALSCVMVAAAPWLRSGSLVPDKRFFLGGFAAAFCAALGFLAGTPYSVITSAKFLKDVGYESRHMSKGHTTAIDGWSQYWMYHFSRSVIPGVSWALALTSLIAAGLLLRAGTLYGKFFVFLLLLFYLTAEYVKSKPAPQPERYILPVIPFVALLSAILLDRFVQVLKSRFIVLVVSALLIAWPLYKTVRISYALKHDSRERMSAWIDQNVEKGSGILIDRFAYSPLLNQQSFRVQYLSGSSILEDLDVRNLKGSGFDYLVISSLFYERYFTEPDVEPAARERIRQLFRQLKVVTSISPDYATYGFHDPTLVLFSLKSSTPQDNSSIP